ncbi:tetratricopeptide repeat protein [Bradyrhizobium sp. CCGB01]|uniref:tetratricopeptide repeat protein n=1 Tax=Bradyrhizobium sp. CCGB01 TaxID=2949634 RepID=UPI0020B3BFE7|nr:tetratricopeptide repeat protein [Bradyrhizobium sp. CCGB01]MCP3404074.1 tetratricopeptide repeat protein [Bradyrhizobium sp. CCGB01]
MSADRRSPDQWWMLGEYLVFNGLLDEDESLINEGIDALTEGANLPNPSIACLMDLGWILSSRGLDSLALPYLQKASELAPDSRDVLSLKALAEIGAGKREAAIRSLALAVDLPNATRSDRERLSALQEGEDLRALRKQAILRKIGFGDPDLARHPPTEQAKAAVHLLKAVHDRDLADISAAYHLAYARYVAGQLSQAKPLLDSVVAADPDKDEAWTILGLIAKKTGDPDGELAMYRKAIEANPRSALALMNFASRTMHEDVVRARNYLQTAIDEMGPDSPHYACALHLMGNSFAYLEQDYSTEIEYHKKAVALEPGNGLYRDNLILAFLSAGRPIDARRLWKETKQIPSVHPLIKDELIAAFCDETLDPREYLVIVGAVGEHIGAPGRRVLLNRAWRRRSHAEHSEQLEFLSGLATMAVRLATMNWLSRPGGMQLRSMPRAF